MAPAEAIYELDWRSGKKGRRNHTHRRRALGYRGLYEPREAVDGTWAFSFTMLTLNADARLIFNQLHRPDPKWPPDLQDKPMAAIFHEDFMAPGSTRRLKSRWTSCECFRPIA